MVDDGFYFYFDEWGLLMVDEWRLGFVQLMNGGGGGGGCLYYAGVFFLFFYFMDAFIIILISYLYYFNQMAKNSTPLLWGVKG